MTTQEPPTSLRLVALRKDLESGSGAALDSFWNEIATSGTPLVEPIKSDDHHMMVTFLWRARGETNNVAIIGGPTVGWLPPKDSAQDKAMIRLLDTDVWYKTYRVRTDARVAYLLSPNDPLLTPDQVHIDDAPQAQRQPDPFNPRRFFYPQDPEGPKISTGIVSMVELPDAPPQPFVSPLPGVPTGKVEVYRLKSNLLGNERRVWLYTPPDYAPEGQPYNLLLLFDGWEYTQWIPTPTILDNMTAKGLIQPLVAIMLDTPNRVRELSCYPPFVNFLAEELLPFVRQRCHVTSNPTQTVVGGCSLGGLAATHTGLCRSDIFGNVLSQSGSYLWTLDGDTEPEGLARRFASSQKMPLHFYLEVGLLERVPVPSDGLCLLTANRHMRDVLIAKDYPVHYSEFNGRHEFANWQGGLSNGLLALLGKDKAQGHH